MGEKYDAPKVEHLNSPNGKRDDAAGKITPFKVMKGKQLMDTCTGVIADPARRS